MKIYLNEEGKMEIQSLEAEPWTEKDLFQTPWYYLVLIMKILFERLDITSIEIDDQMKNDAPHALRHMIIHYQPGIVTIGGLRSDPTPGAQEIFQTCVEKLLEANFMACGFH